MLNRFSSEKLFCGLDIGSQRLKASLVKARGTVGIQLLDVYESKTNGFKDASVSDLMELVESIQATMNGLMKKTETRVKEVALGVGGEVVTVHRNESTIPLVERGNKVITSFDIKKVNTQARLLGAKMDEEIIHDIPQVYKVDDVNIATNPLGLYGRKIEAETLLIVANGTRLQNIIKAVHQAGFEVLGPFFTSYAAADAVLGETEKANGSVLLDIGSRITTLMIYRDGILKYLMNIPWGGNDVTRRIAQDLNLSFDLAEDIKKSYAVALSTDKRNEEEILIKRDSAFIPIKCQEIYQSIDPEIVYLVQFIKDSLNASGLFNQINSGIYLIGGGALLPGLMERIEEGIQLTVSVGKFKSPSNICYGTASYAAAFGLAQLAASQSYHSLSLMNTLKPTESSVVTKLKEIYHEYF